MPKRTKLTKTTVDRLRPKARRYSVYDESLPGFEIRVNVDGTKTAAVRYRTSGRARRMTLGKIGEAFPLTKARAAARRVLGEASAGKDPARERDRERSAPTFAAVAERFMDEYAAAFLRPRTIDGYRTLLRRHLLPELGAMKIHEIERRDVERVHLHVGKGKGVPGAADRMLTMLSSLMTRAETWGYRPLRSNPCYKIRRFGGRTIERFLSPEERARLGAVLETAERSPKGHPEYFGPGCIAAVRLLAHTGARKGEIVGLQWSMVDLDRALLRLPESKTGEKVIPLSPPAVALLRGLAETRDPGVPWVCASETGERLYNLGRSWEKLRRRAGLDDVRLHDLRHSAASDALMAGVPLALVGAMLGHKSPTTTKRYAHLADATLQEAARMMGEAIEQNTREGAERLRQQRAVGDGQGAGTGAGAVESKSGKVLRFPGPRRG